MALIFIVPPSVKKYFKRFKKIAIKHNCLILFIHHLGKNKEFLVPNKSSLLGSQGVEANARCVLEFRKDRFESDLRHLILLKGNYHKDALKNYSHVLKFNEENMVFTNTGKTRAIEELAGDRKINEKSEMVTRAMELDDKGVSWIQITKEISKEFDTKVSKSSLNNWVNEEKKKQKFYSKGKVDNVDQQD
jgi:hypothetical protein